MNKPSEGVVIRGEYLNARAQWARGGRIGSTRWCQSALVEVLDLENKGCTLAARLLLNQAFNVAVDSKRKLTRKTLRSLFRNLSTASLRPEKVPELEQFPHSQDLFVLQAFESFAFGDGREPTKPEVEQKAKRLCAIRYLVATGKLVLPNVQGPILPAAFDQLLKFSPSEERLIAARSKHWRALATDDWKRCGLSDLKNGGGRPQGALNAIKG